MKNDQDDGEAGEEARSGEIAIETVVGPRSETHQLREVRNSSDPIEPSKGPALQRPGMFLGTQNIVWLGTPNR